MAKSLINDRALIPLFHCLARDGQYFDSSDFKRKRNLVIYLLTHPTLDFLLSLEEVQGSLREQNAEVLVVTQRSVPEIQNLHSQHRLTYWILSDEERGVLGRFVQAADQEKVAALFIADKFGEVFFQYIVADVADLPPYGDIAQSLAFIQSQCPECGT
ncbi:MAG: redoxin domain-containing protein [Candidatus Omnitrophota bacterium]